MASDNPSKQQQSKSFRKSVRRFLGIETRSTSQSTSSSPTRGIWKFGPSKPTSSAEHSVGPFSVQETIESVSSVTFLTAAQQQGHNKPAQTSGSAPLTSREVSPRDAADQNDGNLTAIPQQGSSLSPVPSMRKVPQPAVDEEETIDSGVKPTDSPVRTQDAWTRRLGATKDALHVGLTFTEMLLKKLPDVVDGNPVKMAFGIAKLVLEIKDGVINNIDAVEQQIVFAADQLLVVEKELSRWKQNKKEETRATDIFKRILEQEVTALTRLKNQSVIRKVAVYEDDKKEIAEVFQRVNQAREQLLLTTTLRIQQIVYAIRNDLVRSLSRDLEPSSLADHNYRFDKEHQGLLRRSRCTPGTRERILTDIVTWVNDTSPETQTVYWLSGQAGSGKSTIAYTIAQRFDLSRDSRGKIILGGNFFCSRQFEETRASSRIIRTIVYHLALRCKPFADALNNSGRFDTIHHDVRAQLEGLLIGPWQESKAERLADSSTIAHYLIVIDALDEIDGDGGPQFLREVLDVINEHRLQGLKIFVTSRSDPNLVTHLQSFDDKRFYRLEEIPLEEARTDIKTYLYASLPHFAGRTEMDILVEQAAGLFIYAATVVKYLSIHQPFEQNTFLKNLISVSSISPGKMWSTTDQLYYQILNHAFGQFEDTAYTQRLGILHTFLCTAERTSTSVATQLLNGDSAISSTDAAFSPVSITDSVIELLHAVLYTEDNKVLWFHKSFPDFLFDKTRSKEFWCDASKHHGLLIDSCFSVMNADLKFNIANIPSSFLFDYENPTLANSVKQNIPPVLSYCCRNWNYHLPPTEMRKPENNKQQDTLLGTLSDFLQLRILFWIEAMNLLGFRNMCDPMLQMARIWASQYDSELGENLSKAASFALHFSGNEASRSTPHLYVSTLATWLPNMDASSVWRTHFPKIPKFTHALQRGVELMRFRLESEVYAVAYSIDGTRIASGSADQLVRVWDAATGEVLKVLEGHTGRVNAVRFSGDGARIVSGSSDNSLRVWDTTTGEQLKMLEGHTDDVWSVGFSNDGRIVSGSFDMSVRVWDATTGEKLKQLDGHTDIVLSVGFSSDGSRIVSGSGDKSLRVWDSITGEQIQVLEGHTDSVHSVGFSSDRGRIVSGSSDHSVRVWDTTTGEQLKLFMGHTSIVYSVDFSSDGEKIVSGSADKSLRVWTATTGEQLRVLEGHTGYVHSAGFSSDGLRVVSGSYDESMRVWDATRGEQLRVLEGHTSYVCSVGFSSDGSRIVSGSEDESVRIWDATTGEQLKLLDGHIGLVYSVGLSSDGGRIVSGSSDMSVRLWDATTGEQLRILEGHNGPVTSIEISRDGSKIASGSFDMSVRVWDPITGEQLQILEGHTAPVSSVGFSSDGGRIVSGSEDESVRVWDATKGKQLRVLNGHSNYITSVGISSDGSRIVSGSWDRSVRLWDATTGEQLQVLKGHTSDVNSVGISSDSSMIAFGLDDKSVQVWNVTTGTQLAVLEGHTASVTTVRFSNDGLKIVSGSSDRSVRVWDLDKLFHLESLPYLREKLNGVHTGWIISPQSQERLMFVPLSATLPDCSNILTLPTCLLPTLDFSSAALGYQWHECYCP